MSKRSERAAYRAEVLAELRALVAVGRRLAAVAERDKAMRELAECFDEERHTGGCNEVIHTRGPKEGQPITDEEQGR